GRGLGGAVRVRLCALTLGPSVQPGRAPLQLARPQPPGNQQYQQHGERDAHGQSGEQPATGAGVTEKERTAEQAEKDGGKQQYNDGFQPHKRRSMVSRVSTSIDRSNRRRRFAPGWPLWLFTLTFLPLLLSLGMWQLDRAEQKRALAAQMEQQRQLPAAPLGELPADTALTWRARLPTGQSDPRHIWLRDNRRRNGQAGVEILQLFHDQPGDRPLIINRGWLAWPDRRHLPAVPVAEGELQLQAEVLPPPG